MKFETRQAHFVGHEQFEALVRSHFPEFPDYEFTSSEDVSNGTTHHEKVSVEFDKWATRKEHVEELAGLRAAGDASYRTNVLLRELALQGEIPEGDWLIWVWW